MRAAGSVCLQEHFEQPSEQLQRNDGPVKSSLRKITSEVNTALVLIKWLSVLAVENLCSFAVKNHQARLLVADFPAASLWDVAQDQSVVAFRKGEEKQVRWQWLRPVHVEERKKRKKLARGPAAGIGLVGKLIIMVGRLTSEILWF